MIDINSATFIADFHISGATVGQVGYGFIGNAVVELFRPWCRVVVYDKEKSQTSVQHLGDGVFLESTVDSVVKQSEVIFVAVPTPMKPSGECHTGIVESVIQDIQNAAIKIGRPLDSFVVVLKSTVPPGFTRRMQDRYALRLLFSPEFLTEANAVRDFKSANRVLLGGDIEDARIAFKYFEGVWPDRQRETWVDNPDGPVSIVQCESDVAEMVKLSTNVHLAARVMISNELYLICEKLGVKYDDVKLLTQLDRRIGLSHMDVPGPDGKLGVGGHCFPKDLNSLAFISEELELSGSHPSTDDDGSDTNLFRSLHRRNLGIRDDRDWEAQKGRAVIDD